MADRTVLHCDCNCFFASVEMANHPEYRGVPLAVCGSVENRHGIVLAKNEAAKKFGIRTAETVFSAKKKCPGLVIAPPHYDQYLAYSARVGEIYKRYTDMIEPFGIDESWLDVSASRRAFGDGREIAERIRREVREEIGITVSVGVSFNKVFAKLGSDYKKPDAVTEITRENYREIVYPLPVSDLLFVGKKTAQTLYNMGIRTIGELAATDPVLLSLRLGKAGTQLSKYARGEDDSPVEAHSADEQKSISNGFTFRHDLVGREACRTGIDFLSEEIGMKLRKKRAVCTTVTISVKDESLHVLQKQTTLRQPTDLSADISAEAYRLFCGMWDADKPVRAITVGVSGLEAADSRADQVSFFDDGRAQKYEKLKEKENAVDKIRQKFGSTSIIKGNSVKNDFGIYDFDADRKDKKEGSPDGGR